jgi:diguanylate cyclase (GGDEF)-like protein
MSSTILLAIAGILGWLLYAFAASNRGSSDGALPSLPPWASAVGIVVILMAAFVVARSGRRAIVPTDGALSHDPSTGALWDVSGHSSSAARSAVITGVAGEEHHILLKRRLSGEIARSGRHGHPLSVLSISLDSPRELESAPPGGAKRVLATVGEIVLNSIRVSDAYGHDGPDTLLVVLAETDAKGAGRVAEKLRRNVEVYPFGEALAVTVSVGVAGYHPGGTADELIARANDARERAAEAGGNQVVS